MGPALTVVRPGPSRFSVTSPSPDWNPSSSVVPPLRNTAVNAVLL